MCDRGSRIDSKVAGALLTVDRATPLFLPFIQILLFRKGRVSVNPNLPSADLHALAALSVMSKPHTALLSTSKGPQGQHAAAQLKGIYEQMKRNNTFENIQSMLPLVVGDEEAATHDLRLPPLPRSASISYSSSFTAPHTPTNHLPVDLPSHPRRPLSAETAFLLPRVPSMSQRMSDGVDIAAGGDWSSAVAGWNSVPVDASDAITAAEPSASASTARASNTTANNNSQLPHAPAIAAVNASNIQSSETLAHA